jgi:hydrogenase maturation protease
MRDLREQLRQIFQGRVCFMGLGNPDYGDDGFGVYLAQLLIDAGVSDVILAGKSPEKRLDQLSGFDHVIFLDAVDLGTAPGAVALLESSQMAARFPQVSTHKLSLGLLARWIESNEKTRAWLLGAQPEHMQGTQLTSTLQKTLQLLMGLLIDCIGVAAVGYPAERKLGSKSETNA